MSQTYHCPGCRSEIPLSDINVSADVALCRHCGKSTRFSLLSGVSEIGQAQLDRPPKGVRVTQSVVGGSEILYRRVSPVVFFFIPFTIFWSGLSLSGIYGSQIRSGHFDPSKALFGLPFLIGTVVLLGVILFMLLGRWRVRLDGGRGEVFVGVGPIGWTRNFLYGPDTAVSLEMTSIQKNNVPQRAIALRNGESVLKFGALIPEEAKRYIAAVITQHCMGT
jgi:hypothetical protein